MRISDWSSDVCSSDLLPITTRTETHASNEFPGSRATGLAGARIAGRRPPPGGPAGRGHDRQGRVLPNYRQEGTPLRAGPSRLEAGRAVRVPRQVAGLSPSHVRVVR